MVAVATRCNMRAIGSTTWVIPEGYIPEGSHGPQPEMTSHGTACILNCGDEAARIEITIYYADREPVHGYRLTVPARRTLHARFNDLEDPEPIRRATEFSAVVQSDRPVVVQHTRLDSRQAANALMTTMAYAPEEH